MWLPYLLNMHYPARYSPQHYDPRDLVRLETRPTLILGPSWKYVSPCMCNNAQPNRRILHCATVIRICIWPICMFPWLHCIVLEVGLWDRGGGHDRIWKRVKGEGCKCCVTHEIPALDLSVQRKVEKLWGDETTWDPTSRSVRFWKCSRWSRETNMIMWSNESRRYAARRIFICALYYKSLWVLT